MTRIAAVLTAVLLAGCTGDAGMGMVTGTVTLDGEPLREGLIRFVPADGKSPTADTRVVNGKFQATVPLGEKIVEITAPKVVGKIKMYESPDSPVVDKVSELLPARYNVQSELRMTVVKGAQDRPFPLTTK